MIRLIVQIKNALTIAKRQMDTFKEHMKEAKENMDFWYEAAETTQNPTLADLYYNQYEMAYDEFAWAEMMWHGEYEDYEHARIMLSILAA